MAQSTRRRDHAGLWWALLLLLGGAATWGVLSQGARAARLVEREDAALVACRSLLEVQERIKAQRGRYAWLEQPSTDGALADGLEAQAAAIAASAPGYRLDVLLPSGRNALGQMVLIPHGAGQPDLLLSSRHVAVVARPTQPGVSGLRSYYLDETGRAFLHEGVVDALGLRENALPSVRLERPGKAEEIGSVWRRLDDPEAG